eukprot:m.1201677 g.1201677  ORF g.1201677 m.1201677 type:complete len:203 (+) comp24576_c0_seq7:476-1084(+)
MTLLPSHAVFTRQRFQCLLVCDCACFYVSCGLQIPNVKKPPRFKNLSSMVEHYSQKKQKGMGSKLNPYDLDKALNDVGQDEALLAELDCTSADAERGGALVNPGYHAVAPSRNPQGMANPGYIGNASGGIVSEYRVAVPAYAGSPGKTSGGYVFISPESPDHNGYIQISEKCFTTDEGIVVGAQARVSRLCVELSTSMQRRC